MDQPPLIITFISSGRQGMFGETHWRCGRCGVGVSERKGGVEWVWFQRRPVISYSQYTVPPWRGRNGKGTFKAVLNFQIPKHLNLAGLVTWFFTLNVSLMYCVTPWYLFGIHNKMQIPFYYTDNQNTIILTDLVVLEPPFDTKAKYRTLQSRFGPIEPPLIQRVRPEATRRTM